MMIWSITGKSLSPPLYTKRIYQPRHTKATLCKNWHWTENQIFRVSLFYEIDPDLFYIDNHYILILFCVFMTFSIIDDFWWLLLAKLPGNVDACRGGEHPAHQDDNLGERASWYNFKWWTPLFLCFHPQFEEALTRIGASDMRRTPGSMSWRAT